MIRSFYRFFYWVFGWKTVGSISRDLYKYVLIVAPHTSFWDFPVGLGARRILYIDTRFLAKKSLFKFPLGILLKAMGGIPVDRSKSTNLVDQVAEMFAKNEKFVVTLTPEGTRQHVERWRKGFYNIALKANVPIVKIGFNFAKKEVVADEPFYPTGDYDKDIIEIMDFYRGMPGKHPEQGVR